MTTETRFAEIRQDGRRLYGVAIRYGDTARLPWGPERFEAGAFGDVANADVILNVQHNRGQPIARTPDTLKLTDTAEMLSISAELPQTRDADDVLELVRTGVLRGLSIEFIPRDEALENKVRVVTRAELTGVGVVDKPAYPASSVAARHQNRRRRWIWL